METVREDYAPKGVKFYYIYKTLAHPETNRYVQPITLEERLMHVKEAERRLGSKFEWICDSMSNDLKHALGNSPNSEFIIDPQGKVVVHRTWSRPSELRQDLAKLVGEAENPTQLADLEMKTIPPPKAAAEGVVPRIKAPAGMSPLVSEAIFDKKKTPFYAKLRAEAENSLLQDGKGKLYLGFHIDPIYHVHWNNLVEPVRFELKASDGVTLSPSSGKGPKVEEEGDIDPREFIIDIESENADAEIEVTVYYFACNDEEGWCRPVKQKYIVTLQRDRDGGRSSKRSSRGRGRGGPPGGRGPGNRAPGNRARGGRFSGPPSFGGPPGFGGGDRIMGQVISINQKTRIIKVRTQEGDEKSFLVTKDTRLMMDFLPGELEDLRKGDRLMMSLVDREEGDKGPPRVERMMVRFN